MSTSNPINPTLTNILYFLLAAIAVGWVLVIGRDIIIPFVIALVIWYIFDSAATGIVKHSQKWFPLPYWLAMTVTVALTLLIIFFLSDMVAQNALALSKHLPDYQATLHNSVVKFIHRFAPSVNVDIQQALTVIDPQRFLTWLTSLISNLANTLSLIVLYLMFIFLESQVFEQKFARLFTDKDRLQSAIEVRQRIMASISSYLSITTFISVLTGVLSTIALYLIGVDYPIFWGVFIFFTNYIPNIGAILGTVLPTIVVAIQFQGFTWQVFATLISLGLIQFITSNILQPQMTSNSLNLSGLVILLALGIWGALWGITGMLLAVPITVMMMIIFAQFPFTHPIAVLLSSDGKV